MKTQFLSTTILLQMAFTGPMFTAEFKNWSQPLENKESTGDPASQHVLIWAYHLGVENEKTLRNPISVMKRLCLRGNWILPTIWGISTRKGMG